MSGKDDSLLDWLPNYPEIDSPTRILFDGIRKNQVNVIAHAIQTGASIDALEPHHLHGEDLLGGCTPLQAICMVPPGGEINMEALALLLETGADPNLGNPVVARPLKLIAERLPINAAMAIVWLSQAGAIADCDMVHSALLAEKMWSNSNPTSRAIPVARDLWELLSSEQQENLDPHLPVQLVGAGGAATHPQWIKRAKWVLDKIKPEPGLGAQPRARANQPRTH